MPLNIETPSERIDKETREEIAKKLHNQFPQFLKNFLNELAKTRFYKKTLADRKWGYENLANIDDMFFMDWECLSNKVYNKETIIDDMLVRSRYGLSPNYKGDKLVMININFRDKKAHLERGWAVGYYASRVLSKDYDIPKYMRPLVNKLFSDYDEYMKNK